MDDPEQQPDARSRPRPQAARPRPPPAAAGDDRAPSQGRLLDPATALVVDGVVPRPDRVRRAAAARSRRRSTSTAAFEVLRAVAEPLGWDVDLEDEDPRTVNLRFGLRPLRLGRRLQPRDHRPRRLDAAAADPRAVRRRGRPGRRPRPPRLPGVGHRAANPLHALRNPLHDGNPLHDDPCTRPLHGGACSAPIASYRAYPGFRRAPAGGVRRRADRSRRDDADHGPPPGGGDPRHRLRDAPVARRASSTRASTLDGMTIGYSDATSVVARGRRRPVADRSTARSTRSPGTAPSSPAWSARRCPDADILAWRVVPSDGPIVESDLVATLAQIAELARRHRAGEPGGHPIDVLSLSMGYYHETPEDELFDPTMYAILEELVAQRHVVVVLGRQRRDQPAVVPGGVRAVVRRRRPDPVDPTTACRSCRSGALNPNAHRRAVQQRRPVGARATSPGAAVVSTMPALPGRLQPVAAHDARSAGCARRSTPTTSAVASRSGAVRRSRAAAGRPASPRSWRARSSTGDDAGRRARPRPCGAWRR